MLKKITPNLIVKDVNETVQFYKEKLGMFELVSTDPKKGKYAWALMRCEDTDIMFQSVDSIIEKVPSFQNKVIGGNVVLYIETEAIDQLYDWIKDRVKVIKHLHITPYQMKEFIIEDCNGFVLSFAEWHQQ
jgi:lactoylglutathione lyase